MRRRDLFRIACPALALAALVGCSRGGGGETAAEVTPQAAPESPTAAPAEAPATPTLEPTPRVPPSSPTATPAGSPALAEPASTPAARNVNGLMVVDEVWVGVVREMGGLRIRSAPRIEPGNVVGSLPQGAQVTVEGRVLNGQEAEMGKGNVWLIVGPSQYIYAAPGYVERVR